MFILKKTYYKTFTFWRWLLCTVLLSSLPIILSVISAFNTWPSSIARNYINVNDVIFMGLSVTISSLNTWKKISQDKTGFILLFISGICLILLSFFLGLSYSAFGVSSPVKVFIAFVVVVSIITSLEATFYNMSQTKSKII